MLAMPSAFTQPGSAFWPGSMQLVLWHHLLSHTVCSTGYLSAAAAVEVAATQLHVLRVVVGRRCLRGAAPLNRHRRKDGLVGPIGPVDGSFFCRQRCPCSKGKFSCDCDMMCHYPDKRVDGGCCGLKVCLPPFPAPPSILQALWNVNTPGAKLFRENARSFNNALALSSIKVRERRFQQGFCPNVIYEGKVFQFTYPQFLRVFGRVLSELHMHGVVPYRARHSSGC